MPEPSEVIENGVTRADIAFVFVILSALIGEYRDGYEEDGSCVGCGCTDENACPGGCLWVHEAICSACVFKAQNILEALMPDEVLEPDEEAIP